MVTNLKIDMGSKFKCTKCGRIEEHERILDNFIPECHECEWILGEGFPKMELVGHFCLICGYKLQKRHEGLACTQINCPLEFKCERGWVYLDRKEKDNKWMYKYDFNIKTFEGAKKWLKIKSKILIRDNNKCKICGKKWDLHVHHILPRSEYPELTFDEENLMTVCVGCHANLHKDDKHSYFKCQSK